MWLLALAKACQSTATCYAGHLENLSATSKSYKNNLKQKGQAGIMANLDGKVRVRSGLQALKSNDSRFHGRLRS
jgi:hypothetical protein